MHATISEEKLRIYIFQEKKKESKQLLGLPSPIFALKNLVTV